MTAGGFTALPHDRDRWRDEEKAAALDAAIEFEDDLTHTRKGTRKEATIMIDKDVLLELDEAAGELKAAEDKFRGICRKIAEAGEAPVPAPAAKPHKSGVRARPAGTDSAVKTRYLPDKQIKCRKCGLVVSGVRKIDGKSYPYVHPNKETGTTCQGKDIPGELVTGDSPS